MTSGSIRRTAQSARAHVRLDGRTSLTDNDVRRAGRTLHRDIERLATFIPTSGGWDAMATGSTLFCFQSAAISRFRSLTASPVALG